MTKKRAATKSGEANDPDSASTEAQETEWERDIALLDAEVERLTEELAEKQVELTTYEDEGFTAEEHKEAVEEAVEEALWAGLDELFDWALNAGADPLDAPDRVRDRVVTYVAHLSDYEWPSRRRVPMTVPDKQAVIAAAGKILTAAELGEFPEGWDQEDEDYAFHQNPDDPDRVTVPTDDPAMEDFA